MGRRITLLLTSLSVALFAALAPFASLAEPVPQPEVYQQPGGLLASPGLRPADGLVTAMIELNDPPAGVAGNAGGQQIAAAQQQLVLSLAATGAQVLFQSRLAFNGVAVVVPASQLAQLRALPNVASVRIIPPKLPVSRLSPPGTPSAAVAGAISGASGAGVRIGVIDRGIDYTHADFGGAGTPAAYAANDPTTIEPGTFPTAKVIGGYDLAGDAYDATGVAGSPSPTPDPDPLECSGAPGAPAYVGQGTHLAGLMAGYGVTSSGAVYRGPYTPSPDATIMNVSPGIAPEAQIYALKVFGCRGATTLLTAAIERALDPNGDGDMTDQLDVLVISVGTPFGSPDDPDAIAVDNAVRAGVVVIVAAGDQTNTFYSVNSPASARLAIAVGTTDNSNGISSTSARGPVRGNSLLKPDIVAPGEGIPSAGLGSGIAPAVLSGSAAAAAQVAGAAAMLRQLHTDWSPTQIKAALMNSATPTSAAPSLAGAGRLNITSLDTIGLLAYNADGTGGGLSYGAPWVAHTTVATRTLTLANTGPDEQVVSLAATSVATETGVTVQLPAGPIQIAPHSAVQATIGLTIDPQALDFTPDPLTELSQGGRARHYLAEHGGYIQVIGARGGSGTRVRPAHAAHFASVDFYLDETLLDGSLDSREVQEYINTTPGSHVVKLRRDGSAPNSTPIFSAPVELQDGRDYTLIIVGRPGALGLVVVDETIATAPPAGQSLIHYVNANRTEPSWNIGPLDVYLDGVLQVAALEPGSASAFTPIAPGQYVVAFFRAGANPATDRAVARKSVTVPLNAAVLVGTGRHDDDDSDLSDYEQRGFVGTSEIRLGSALLASVPYQVFPIAAAEARGDSGLILAPGAQSFRLGLHNSGARNSGLADVPGQPGTPHTPLASAFELTAISPPIAALAANLRPADLQYVGVTNSYSVTQNLNQFTYVYFGLSSYAPWSTPNEIEYQVWIDANRDGRDDFVLLNGSLGELTGGLANDVFVNVLYPLNADGTVGTTDQFIFWGTFAAPSQSSIDMAPFNSAVMFQRVKAADLALPIDPNNPAGPRGPTPTSFCYRVEARARAQNAFHDLIDRVPDATAAPLAECANRSGELFYDILNPAIAPINTTDFVFSAPIAARPIFVDVDGGTISGMARADVLAGRGGAQLLILHHHNAAFPQAELVPIRPMQIGTP